MKRILFRFIVTLLLPISFLKSEPRVTASVDQHLITMKSRFTFSIEFEDFSSFPGFSYDFKPDFMLISGPSRSTQFSIVNGRSSSKKVLSYTLAPLREGELTIPSFSFSYRGKTYTTDAVKVSVQGQIVNPAARQSRPEQAFIEVIPAKTNIVSGEAVSVIFKLYYQVQVVNYSFDPISAIEGALIENIQQSRNPAVSEENIQGQIYNAAVLRRIIITPTQSGKLIIPPQRVRLEVKSQRGGSFFDDPFFGGAFTQSKDIITPAYTFDVKPLPPGRPETFTGAVGEYSLSAGLDTNSVQANQAITYSITVSGNGNLKIFTFPKITFPKTFQVFEPKVKENIRVQDNGISGSKTWEFVLIPDESGQFELPPATFSYYSPRQNRYLSIEKSVPTLFVSPNERLIVENQGSLTPQQVQFLREDIRHIFSQESGIRPAKISLSKDRSLKIAIASLSMLLILFITSNLLWYRRVNDPAYQRRLSAFSKAKEALRQTDGTELLGISAALNRYLADIFNLLEGEVHMATIERKFPRAKQAKLVLGELQDLMRLLEALKYAPAQDLPKDIKEQVSLMIQKLEDIRE